jgi:hypothetical protein
VSTTLSKSCASKQGTENENGHSKEWFFGALNISVDKIIIWMLSFTMDKLARYPINIVL